MEERRKKGLRYNCDSKWQFGHKCQTPKLFLIDTVELVEESNEMEEQGEDVIEFSYDENLPEISLHAITGSHHPKTMRIVGWLGIQRIVILIDSGSTHNFVDSSICKTTHLFIHREQRIKVKVANGEEVVSERNCLNVKVQLSGFSFLTNTYVIYLSCDMVLDIQWLISYPRFNHIEFQGFNHGIYHC